MLMGNKNKAETSKSDRKTQVTASEAFMSFFDNTVFMALIIFLCLIPLVFSKNIYQSFSLAKAFLFKVSLGTIILIYATQKLFTKWDKSYLLKVKLLAIPMLLFGFFTIISTFQSIDPWISLVGIYTRHLGLQAILTLVFAYFALAFSMQKKKDVEVLLFSFTLCALIVGVYAALQYFNLDFFKWIKAGGQRVPSTAGNANLLGNIVSLIFPIPLYFIFFSKRFTLRLTGALSIFFIIFATIVCQSRANWVAILISMVFYAFLFVRIHKGNQSLKKIILFSITGSLVIVQFLLNSVIIERYDSPILLIIVLLIHAGLLSCFKFQEYWTGIEFKRATHLYIGIFAVCMAIIVPLKIYASKDGFVNKYFSIFHYEELPRYYLIRDSIYVIKKHFFFGTGEGTYRIAYMPHKSLKNEIAEPKANYDSPHNNFLTVFATQGVFAFIAFMAIFVLIFRKGIQAIADPNIKNEDKHLVVTILAAIFSYLVWSLASFDSNVTNPIMVGLYAAFSFLIYELYYKNDNIPKEKECIVGTKVLMGIIIPFAILSIYQSYIIYQGDINYGMGLRIKKAAGRYIKSKDPKERQKGKMILNKAKQYLKKAIKYNPNESFYNIEMADLHHSLFVMNGDRYTMQEIYKYLKLGQVHSWDPGKHYMVKMKTELTRGRRKVAIDHATSVLKDLPHNSIVRSQLGFLLFKEGGAENFKKALKHFERALKVDKRNLISLIYTSEILLRFGKFEVAKNYAIRAIKLHPAKRHQINGLLRRIQETQKKFNKKKSG